MKFWINSKIKAPFDYLWCKSTNEAISLISAIATDLGVKMIEVIDIDYSAGYYIEDGGDYIEVLKWLESAKLSFPIHLRTTDVKELEEMRNIIKRNNWKEV